LCAFTLLTMLFFWRDYERGGDRWLILSGFSTGLAMLTKGPVGLLLPGAIVLLFLLWMRQVKRGFRRAFWQGMFVFLLVSVPWYVWVSLETRGVFFKGFFLKHNFGRFVEPMENHHGPLIYYPLVMLIGCAPWSVFFALTGWHIHRHTRENRGDPRYRFLACWIGVVLVFFSVSSTKLPNYILPLYPAVAILVAHFLDRWRKGELTLPAWGIPLTLVGVVLTGVATTGGMIVGGSAGGSLLRGRNLPGLEQGAFLGIIPLLAAGAMWWFLKSQRRAQALAVFTLAGVLWLGAITAWGILPVENSKAPRPLGETLRDDAGNEDLYVASWDYFQPSLVYYTGRKIHKLFSEEEVLVALDYPVTSYIYMPARAWERIRPRVKEPYRELTRRRDLYRNIDVVVVCNR
jgi:4-amino-4-deoxy-L-arabinose transferase-like glycosyltransferase